MRYIKNHNGDTIVEVMLALTVLSAVLFTSWSIINRSSQISAAARKRVVMVNQLKEQAEILKSLYADNQANVVTEKDFGGATIFASLSNAQVPTNIKPNPCSSRNPDGTITPLNSFYFNASAVPVAGVKPSTAASRDEAVWIQSNGDSSNGYVDFYIRACWTSGGGANQKDDNSQLIVRLNT